MTMSRLNCSSHASTRLTARADVAVYFADSKSPWQRGTKENINNFQRQYFRSCRPEVPTYVFGSGFVVGVAPRSVP